MDGMTHMQPLIYLYLDKVSVGTMPRSDIVDSNRYSILIELFFSTLMHEAMIIIEFTSSASDDADVSHDPIKPDHFDNQGNEKDLSHFVIQSPSFDL